MHSFISNPGCPMSRRAMSAGSMYWRSVPFLVFLLSLGCGKSSSDIGDIGDKRAEPPTTSEPGVDGGTPHDPGSSWVPAPISPNTWTFIAPSPGDAEGREVPPGRGSSWAYDPLHRALLRFGGFTPRFSNALDAFDMPTSTWRRLLPEDENYPTDRPGGGAMWSMQYDSTRQVIWVSGGQATGYSGNHGLWAYKLATQDFEQYVEELPANVRRLTLDVAHNIFVASPATQYSQRDATQIFDLETRQWQTLKTPNCPQSVWQAHYPAVYDERLQSVVVLASLEKEPGVSAWRFDANAKQWERLATNPGPSPRSAFAAAYDSKNGVIMVHGIHPGTGLASEGGLNDTWVLDTASRTWREVATPGPTPMVNGDKDVTTYRTALTFIEPLNRFYLFDADLGVWAFQYNPDAPPGAQAATAGFSPQVGDAAARAPAQGPAEIRLKLPSPLNPKVTQLADNSWVHLDGGRPPGDEVGWWRDKDLGVLVKYGGCGGGSNPFFGAYGNSLSFYDPGTERWYARRVSDISGANRPGTGCTRSVFYDSLHKSFWFFGGASSGPYCPAQPDTKGSAYSYDLSSDRFSPHLITQAAPQPGCNLGFSDDLGISIFPDTTLTWHFDPAVPAWTKVPSTQTPARPYNYQRIAWVKSINAFVMLTTSADGTANRTFAYNAKTQQWRDLNAANQPPFRTSKYGLVYDTKSDALLLFGGSTTWNNGYRRDVWAYIPSENRWKELTKAPQSGVVPVVDDAMHSAYDERYNAVFLALGRDVWAYRYKK